MKDRTIPQLSLSLVHDDTAATQEDARGADSKRDPHGAGITTQCTGSFGFYVPGPTAQAADLGGVIRDAVGFSTTPDVYLVGSAALAGLRYPAGFRRGGKSVSMPYQHSREVTYLGPSRGCHTFPTAARALGPPRPTLTG